MHFKLNNGNYGKNNLQSFAFFNKIFRINKHGSLPGRSTCMQMLECHYNWCVALDNNIVKLICKFAPLGVCHTTLHWIKAFLHDRYQSVILNGS